MGAYGSISNAKAGLIYGIDYNIETLIVASGDSFDFGDPVFVDEADAEKAHAGDNGDDSLKFAGVAVISQRSFADNQGDYPAYDVINVLREGKVWVTVPSGVSSTANKKAYVIHNSSDGDYEKFTTTSGSNYDCGGYFRTNPTSNLAVVEVRGLK
jgi:hypothetical protein